VPPIGIAIYDYYIAITFFVYGHGFMIVIPKTQYSTLQVILSTNFVLLYVPAVNMYHLFIIIIIIYFFGYDD